MTEALFLKLLDFGLTAASMGLAREDVLAFATKRTAEGATPEQVTHELFAMCDKAIADTQAKIDAAR